MKIVESAILSTDLAVYFKKRNSFLELVENGEFDWQGEDKKESMCATQTINSCIPNENKFNLIFFSVLCGMMMTACDVSAIAKPWDVQHRVAKLVADEFFDQGDLEKLQLNTQPIAMMDRYGFTVPIFLQTYLLTPFAENVKTNSQRCKLDLSM